MPICPKCEAEITELDFVTKGQIEYGGNINRNGWWPMQDVETTYRCPECHEELDPEDLDKLNIANEMR